MACPDHLYTFVRVSIDEGVELGHEELELEDELGVGGGGGQLPGPLKVGNTATLV